MVHLLLTGGTWQNISNSSPFPYREGQQIHLHLSTKLEYTALTISRTWKKAELPGVPFSFISADTCCHNLHLGIKHISFCIHKEVKLRKLWAFWNILEGPDIPFQDQAPLSFSVYTYTNTMWVPITGILMWKYPMLAFPQCRSAKQGCKGMEHLVPELQDDDCS